MHIQPHYLVSRGKCLTLLAPSLPSAMVVIMLAYLHSFTLMERQYEIVLVHVTEGV